MRVVGAQADLHVGGIGRGCGDAVEITRKDCTVGRRGIDALDGREIAGEHLRPFVRARVCADERSRTAEHVHRLVVAVGPDGQFGEVGEVGEGKCVAVVLPGRIRCRRHREALEERALAARPESELADDPAVGQRVISHGPVTVVLGFALAAEGRPERVGGDRAEHARTGLVEDLEPCIDQIEVVARTDGAVGVGRGDSASADPGETRRDCDGGSGSTGWLHDGIGDEGSRRSRHWRVDVLTMAPGRGGWQIA